MRPVLSLLVCLALLTGPQATLQVAQASSIEKSIDGKPTIVLDQLVFPKDIVGAPGFEKYLRKVLKREARLVDWGAGSENKIEYRFYIETLKYTVDGRALRIRCEARGRMPGGQSAKSELTFGGDIGSRKKLTQQVLEIVARGVITRLSELERRRRGLKLCTLSSDNSEPAKLDVPTCGKSADVLLLVVVIIHAMGKSV